MRLGNADAADAAFARAYHVTRLSLHNNRLTAVTMEPRGCIAEYDPGTRRYTLYTSTQNVHGVRQTLAHQNPACAGEPHPRRRARCRRRLWHEGQRLSRRGGRRLGGAPGRPAGQMDPVALRGAARRLCRARPESQRRAGARRRRQVSRPALDRLAQCRRLYRGRGRDPDHLFAKARLDCLRHPRRIGDKQPRLYQYRADRPLSRRRPPGSGLHHGAPRRPGGARDAHRSGRVAQEEPDPPRRLPL